MNQFPQIFVIAQAKNMFVEEAYGEGNDRREWSVNVTRNLNDWEIEEYEAVFQLQATTQLNDNGVICLEIEEWSFHSEIV